LTWCPLFVLGLGHGFVLIAIHCTIENFGVRYNLCYLLRVDVIQRKLVEGMALKNLPNRMKELPSEVVREFVSIVVSNPQVGNTIVTRKNLALYI
jgi:hypothetical protein